MPVDGVASSFVALSQARVQYEVATRVLKTARESAPAVELSSQLLASVEQAQQAVDEQVANLAASVDVYA